MAEPIEISLKSEEQIELARLQDVVVQLLFELDQDLTMHGGTAIWRCYNGNRFSEDVDIYANDKQVEYLLNELPWKQSSRGLRLDHSAIPSAEFTLSDEFSHVKIQIQKPVKGLKPIQMSYKKADGASFVINTLSPSDFTLEKISAYESRHYIRDLYDIYHLITNYDINKKAKSMLKTFIKGIERSYDENTLKDFIYVGKAPSFGEMVKTIKGRLE